jgi:hypothetical protein
MTRPDLAFAYSELSKYVRFPGKLHMGAAGGLDADWAGDTDTRRSHTGFVLMFNGGPISWKSRRQDSVALSTSEAEYMAASA